jgi:hypothetical protein
MVYAGFYVEILNANPLNPIKLTLVSPSAGNRQLAKDCSPANPMLIHDRYSKKRRTFRREGFNWLLCKLSETLSIT